MKYQISIQGDDGVDRPYLLEPIEFDDTLEELRRELRQGQGERRQAYRQRLRSALKDRS